jgi:hypothetical protein
MKNAKAKFVEATENSIVYRWLGVIMQAICVGASCTFVDTNIYLTTFYIWFGVIGNYLSYRYRDKKPFWLDPAVYIGCLAVAAYCVQDLIADYEMGQYALMRPIVHLLAGILVMHSFELRDRSDIYASLILGLLVLCVSAPAGRSVIFGAGILTFITLGGVMFYLDARSRNAIVADDSYTTLEEFGLNKNIPSRSGLPGTVFSIALLPLLSIFVFMFVPRGDTYIDKLAAKVGSQFSAAKNNDPNQLAGVSKDAKIKRIDERAPHSQSELQLPQPKAELKKAPLTPSKEKSPPSKSPQTSQETDTRTKTDAAQKADAKPNRANYREGAIYPGTKGSKEPPKKFEGKAKPVKSATKTAKSGKGADAGKPAKTETKAVLEKRTKADKPAPTNSSAKPAPSPAPHPPAKKPREKPNYGLAVGNGKANGFAEKSMFLIDEPFDDKDDRLVMTVSCPRTAYVKRMYYDTFDGREWTSSDDSQLQILARTDQGFSNCTDLSQFVLPPAVEAIQTDQVYTVAENFGKPLSFIGIPQKIDLGPLAVFATPSGDLFCDNSLPTGYKYSVRASMPLWNLDDLRKAPKETEDVQSLVKEHLSTCLELPDEDPMVHALAAEIAGDGNWFSQAENIVGFLRTHYKYDVNKKYEGVISNYADEFLLRTRAGDCKEFASAFVMLCRCQGIPARCVSGFTPGTQNMVSGLREIRRKDAHVWCQVYIPSCAWIDFDAVPDGNLPAKKAESNYSAQTIAKQVYGENAISPLKILGMVAGAISTGVLIFYAMIILGTLKNRKPQEKFDLIKFAPNKGIYKKVMKSLKAIDFIKAPHETYQDFAERIAQTQHEQALGGKPIHPELSPKLEKFLKLYAERFFGRVDNSDELEKAGAAIIDHLKTRKLSKRR